MKRARPPTPYNLDQKMAMIVEFKVLMMAGVLSIGSATSEISHIPQIRGYSVAHSYVLGDRSVSALRLRGGSDVKEAATGILFPKELVSGNNTLTVG